MIIRTLTAPFFIFYRFLISPFLHVLSNTLLPMSACRFVPSCSEYAREVLGTFPLHRALFLIGRRILRCHPFCDGGVDPVSGAHETRNAHSAGSCPQRGDPHYL